MKTIKTLLSFVIAAIICISVSSAQDNKKTTSVNGKIYTIRLTKLNGKYTGKKWINDEIRFESNQLHSKVMSSKERYKDAVCTGTVKNLTGATIEFETNCKTTSGALLVWKGTIDGANIKGTTTWDSGNDRQQYNFSGTLKAE
jgi:hypothetical protein